MLEHGGNLLEMAKRYGIPQENWLDLSTGINPLGYPVPAIPAECWRRLPEQGDGLLEAARAYYGTQHLITAAGSQPLIQALPKLRPPGRVAILSPTYVEHQAAWTRGGHEVIPFDSLEAGKLADVLVLCNPNNPTGRLYKADALLAVHASLAGRGAWLVVDEAFMDASPGHSLASHAGLPGLIVLRSLGKFFGLAGARVGFALAWPDMLERLAVELGPWPVSGPARWVAQSALQDLAWQEQTWTNLRQSSERLGALLIRHGLPCSGGTALFQWTLTPRAAILHGQFARQAILVRQFHEPDSLRFGLPGGEAQWQRLVAALNQLDCTP